MAVRRSIELLLTLVKSGGIPQTVSQMYHMKIVMLTNI